jgi:hypothetical protein
MAMKSKFPDIVEKGRVTMGPYATNKGDLFGLFFLKRISQSKRYKIIVSDGLGWDHVSVTLSNNKIPTWLEMCWLKSLFFKDDETVIQYHPKQSDYVNAHKGCLHLWRPQQVDIPTPPIEFV